MIRLAHHGRLLAVCIFSLTMLFGQTTVSAAILSLGSLSRDTSSNVVVDSGGLEWLMWNDPTTYTWDSLNNTLLAPGGSLHGWRVAQETDVFTMFSNAGWNHRYGGASCFDNLEASLCGSPPANADRNSDVAFTNSFNELFFGDTEMFSARYNYAFFETNEHSSSSAFGDNNGIMGVEHRDTSTPNSFIQIDWGRTIPDSDRWTVLASGESAIRFALVRGTVPSPSTGALFCIAILALGINRRKWHALQSKRC